MDETDRRHFYQALRSRDPRYDGRFYYGVSTTGIYCRPICPAKPKIQNVHFYKSKAEAESAGFRPCLRCRPDLSPSSPQWTGTAAVMGRALSLVEKENFQGNLQELAARLGMTDRHLRRLFQEHVGASPVEVAISRRLHLARQLLSQTKLSMLDVALAAGFQSSRRFNDAFVKTYRTSPREFRRQTEAARVEGDLLRIEIPYTAPFDWDQLIGFFESHAVAGVESVGKDFYSRQFQTSTGLHWYRVQNRPEKSRLSVELKLSSLSELRPTIEKIRTQFDLGHNPHHIEIDPKRWKKNKDLVQQIRAMRVPGAFDAFEMAVTVILGQLVSVEQAQQNVRKLVHRYGEAVSHPAHPELTHLFPTADVLKTADFAGLGFTQARGAAIRELARRVASGDIDFSRGCDLEVTRAKLLSVKGIGPWSVEMMALRCLSDPDSFPAKDLIILRALQKFDLDQQSLQPWRAYLTLAIWKTQAHLLSKKRIRLKDESSR